MTSIHQFIIRSSSVVHFIIISKARRLILVGHFARTKSWLIEDFWMETPWFYHFYVWYYHLSSLVLLLFRGYYLVLSSLIWYYHTSSLVLPSLIISASSGHHDLVLTSLIWYYHTSSLVLSSFNLHHPKDTENQWTEEHWNHWSGEEHAWWTALMMRDGNTSDEVL